MGFNSAFKGLRKEKRNTGCTRPKSGHDTENNIKRRLDKEKLRRK
jgi:hypothetical protein